MSTSSFNKENAMEARHPKPSVGSHSASMLSLSKHARYRAKQMKVPTKEVKRILQADDLTIYPSNVAPHLRVAVAGRLAIPYDPATNEAITVLWRGEDRREHARRSV